MEPLVEMTTWCALINNITHLEKTKKDKCMSPARASAERGWSWWWGRARDPAIGRVGPRRLWGHSSHCSRISLHIHVRKALLLNGDHHKWQNDKHRHQLLAIVCIKGKSHHIKLVMVWDIFLFYINSLEYKCIYR